MMIRITSHLRGGCIALAVLCAVPAVAQDAATEAEPLTRALTALSVANDFEVRGLDKVGNETVTPPKAAPPKSRVSVCSRLHARTHPRRGGRQDRRQTGARQHSRPCRRYAGSGAGPARSACDDSGRPARRWSRRGQCVRFRQYRLSRPSRGPYVEVARPFHNAGHWQIWCNDGAIRPARHGRRGRRSKCNSRGLGFGRHRRDKRRFGNERCRYGSVNPGCQRQPVGAGAKSEGGLPRRRALLIQGVSGFGPTPPKWRTCRRQRRPLPRLPTSP